MQYILFLGLFKTHVLVKGVTSVLVKVLCGCIALQLAAKVTKLQVWVRMMIGFEIKLGWNIFEFYRVGHSY